MSTLSRDVGALAPGHTLLHDGVTYTFRHLDITALATFERENYRKKRDALRELKDDYTEEQYLARLDELRRNFDRHHYSLENDKESLQSIDGVLMILRLMLGVPDEDIGRLFRERREETIQLMNVTLRESFPEGKKGGAERTAEAPTPR